ncbi:MAG: hypothetical protein ACYCOU_06300, partial [Sulfobacillus sp.]
MTTPDVSEFAVTDLTWRLCSLESIGVDQSSLRRVFVLFSSVLGAPNHGKVSAIAFRNLPTNIKDPWLS